MAAVVHGVRGKQDAAGLLQIKDNGHVTGRVPRRVQQLDCPVVEKVQLAFDALPLQAGAIEVRPDVSACFAICGMGGVELTTMHDDRRLRKVPERASVVHVQVGLHDVAYRVRRDAEFAQLRNAVRAYAVEDPSPARILTRVNRMLDRVDPGETRMAMACITLRTSTTG